MSETTGNLVVLAVGAAMMLVINKYIARRITKAIDRHAAEKHLYSTKS